MKNLDLIAEELFNKIRGRFPSVTIGNDNGEVTNVPKEARFYDFDYKEGDKSLGKVSVSLTNDSVSIMYSNDFVTNEDQITKTNWYNFLKELRVFAKKRLLNFDTRDITKSNLDKRDYQFLATNRPGEVTMESRMYGTSKTSYQNIGSARLAIKHTQPVNTESATGRIQNIKAIYIESEDGERFRYPAKHLNGARAMARHVAEGGKPYDDFGKHITGLSEELANLKKFKSYVNRSGVVAEGLGGYIDVVNERLNAVKKTISALQKESTYRQAVETFEATEFTEVPDDVAENWIDQLTIKQFNEELKDVFPYIYRLVSEATRAKALGPKDILGENEQEDIYVVRQGDTVYDLSRRSGTPVEDIIEINGLDDNATIRVGQELIVPNINQIGASPTTPGATRGIDPRDAYSPDDFQRLTRGTPAESFESHMNQLMGQFAEESNQYEITPAQRKMANIGHKMRHGLEPSSGIDWDDRDFNLAAELSTQLIQLGTNFGPKTIAAALANVGSEGISVEEAQRLIRHAMGEEETAEGRKRDVDGDSDIDSDDYMAARDVAIKKAMRQNDDEEVQEQELPLSEFILGYFDRHSGQFPKGETAVLTMVEKQYGENFITPAKQFIGMINNKMAEMYGYRDNGLEETDSPQELNQQILGFLRHLMQNDRQLGYRASDLARQHPGQPKMALQALQSDPEINKMWQNYSNMNTMTSQPQNMNTRTSQPQGMNTRETFSLETASVDDAMNLLKTNSTGIFNRLKSQLMPQIQAALRSGTTEEKALAQQWIQIFKAAENLGESTENKLKEALSSNDVADLMGAIRDLIVKYSDEASSATGDSAVDVAADDAARQEPPTTNSGAKNNTQTPITRNTGYNFNSQEAANAYLDDTQPGDVATVGRNKERIVRDIDDNGNPVWTPEQDYTGRNANRQPAAQSRNTRTQQSNRNNNRNNNSSGEPIPTFPSMQAAMQMVDYYQPGERVDINGQPHVRDIDPNGRKIYRPTRNESIDINTLAKLAGLA